MTSQALVFLVPGYFGFTSVGALSYLADVGHCTLAGGPSENRRPSGAGHTPQAFEATWDAVATAIAGDD
ncbi:MAG: hypothetical protein Q8K91_17385 [Hylemonella sp.]|nr:hypothetical protein [Hylemonella sp.]